MKQLVHKTPNKYEVEILSNPTAGKKDTREVNSVIIFEASSALFFAFNFLNYFVYLL